MRLFTFLSILAVSTLARAAGDATTLWYDQPAAKWDEALPLGNGRLGAVDFCLRAIDEFEVQGLSELKELHQRQKKAIGDSRAQARKLSSQARSNKISANLREKVEADIRHRENALLLLETNWETYVQSFQGLQSRLVKFYSRIPELKLIRDNAKAQVDVLSLLGVLRLAQSNVLGRPKHWRAGRRASTARFGRVFSTVASTLAARRGAPDAQEKAGERSALADARGSICWRLDRHIAVASK
jgi:hypothetical protein